MARKTSPGCLIGFTCLIVFTLLASWAAYTGYQQNKQIDTFTVEQPTDLGVTYRSPTEVFAVRDRVRQFGSDAVEGKTVELRLSAADLNDVIGHEEKLFDFRKMIVVTGISDVIEARVSLPMKTVFRGGVFRYLNGTALIKPSVREGQALLEIAKLTSDNGAIPEGFSHFIAGNLNMIAMFRDDKIIGPALQQITSMTLEGGFLLVRAN